MNKKEKKSKTPSPDGPERRAPVLPDENPDPSKKPEENDPTKIREPEKPTRIKEPDPKKSPKKEII